MREGAVRAFPGVTHAWRSLCVEKSLLEREKKSPQTLWKSIFRMYFVDAFHTAQADGRTALMHAADMGFDTVVSELCNSQVQDRLDERVRRSASFRRAAIRVDRFGNNSSIKGLVSEHARSYVHSSLVDTRLRPLSVANQIGIFPNRFAVSLDLQVNANLQEKITLRTALHLAARCAIEHVAVIRTLCVHANADAGGPAYVRKDGNRSFIRFCKARQDLGLE